MEDSDDLIYSFFLHEKENSQVVCYLLVIVSVVRQNYVNKPL